MRRIVLLLASMALAVLFGSGVALADSPTTKEDCKNGGYAKYGFKKQGQCIEAVNQAPPADTTAPVLTQVAGPAEGELYSGGQIVFESNEPVTYTYDMCAVSSPGTCPNYREYGGGDTRFELNWSTDNVQGDTPMVFYLKAVDAAGNVTMVERRWTQEDTTKPVVTGFTGIIKTGDNDIRVEFGANEPATFECSLTPINTGYIFEPCTSPFVREDLPDGHYIFAVRAIDAAGNDSADYPFSTVVIDAKPVFYLPDTLGPFENRSATVEWTTSEPVHSVKCELYLNQSNGEVVQINIDTACSSPKAYQGINPGTYTFIVSGRDSSNQLSEPYEVQFEVI